MRDEALRKTTRDARGRRIGVRLLVACALLVVLAPVAPASAAGEPEGWSYTSWRELMSPFCPGRSLADCPSPQADSLRMWILTQEAAGRTRADVEDELYQQFGDVILAAPRAEGFGITAYAIPVVVFIGGGLLVGLFLWRQTRGRSEPPRDPVQATVPLDPEMVERIERELSS
jgi:cytochrome c-type biogenesis protein CcmH/NrfF